MPTTYRPAALAALTPAIAAVDRELAANLELTTMFDQTRQAVVLENGEFAHHRAVLADHLAPDLAALAVRVYDGIPAAESAMERRGPAGTLKDADRLVVESWEGDARELQRLLRAALLPPVLGAVAAPAAASTGVLARLGDALRRAFRS